MARKAHPWFWKLVKPFTKTVANLATGGVAGEVAGEVADQLVKSRTEKSEEAQAKAKLKEIGPALVRTLGKHFEDFAKGPNAGQVNVEAVALQVESTLEPALTAAFFIKHDLDPARLEAAIRKQWPLPSGHFGRAETDLYNRGLHHAVIVLAEAAGKIKGLSTRATGEQLSRLTALLDGVDAIVGALDGIAGGVDDVKNELGRVHTSVAGIRAMIEEGGQAVSNSVADKFAEFEVEYRRAVAGALDELELFGVDLTPESRKQKLSVAYISLSLDAPASTGEVGPTPVEGVLDSVGRRSRRLLLRGEAGSGKSTLFRWAALAASEPELQGAVAQREYKAAVRRMGEWRATIMLRELPDKGPAQVRQLSNEPLRFPLRNWYRSVPFLILLRNCPKGQMPSVDGFAAHTVPPFRAAPEGWAHAVMKEGAGLVLIDGIDEVPTQYRPRVMQQLRQLVRTYPDCYYVISTRPAALAAGELADLNFREAEVSPMSPTDRGLLIAKWHDAVREQVARTRGAAEAAKLDGLADLLVAHLRENAAIAGLATNPLMAAMVCALHRDRNRKLPEDQYELVEALCHMILYRRERESGLDLSEFDPEYRDLTYPQRKAIMSRLAEHMVEQELSAVPDEIAKEKIADALRVTRGGDPADAGKVLKGLIERSGILRAKSHGSVDFIHNAFKEFLAAWRMVREHKAKSMAKGCGSRDWQNVLLFAAATPDDEGFATELVGAVLPSDDVAAAAKPRGRKTATAPDAVALRAKQLMAIRMAAVAQQLDPDLSARVAKLSQKMFPPRSPAEAQALAALGDVAVPQLKPTTQMKEKPAIATLRALRLIGTEAAQARLEQYARSSGETRLKVIAELAQAVNPLTIPEVVHRLITESDKPLDERLPEGIRAQIIDLSPLAGSGLTRLDLWKTKVADLAPLAGLTALTWLILNETPVADVAQLAGLTALTKLYLNETPIADVAPLAKLTALTTLYMNSTKVADVAPLAGLTALTTLSLWGTKVADIVPLAGLTALTSLDLSCMPVADVAPLAGLTALATLSLSNTPVADIAPLAELTALTTLDLSNTQVTDIAPLAGLTALTTLSLWGTKVADIVPLAGLTALTSLDLSCMPVADVAPLAELTALTTLYLHNTPVADVAPLAGLKRLRRYSGPPIPGRPELGGR